ncbi:MAG: GntR family transcriptional regulator [Clostridiaceae bacterium]
MLNTNDPVPLYKQLMDEIKESISTGYYKPGDRLPSEIEMAKQNGVSVITARKAVSELAKEGIVNKRQGKGTFVAVQKYKRDINQIMSFSESCRSMGAVPGGRLLERKLMIPDGNILKELELPPLTQVVYISRLRFANGEPIAIEISYFPIKYAFLMEEPLDDNSLFEILDSKSNTRITKSRKSIEICWSSAKEAELLRIKKKSPLLLIHSTAYSETGQIVFAGTQLINGARFKLRV